MLQDGQLMDLTHCEGILKQAAESNFSTRKMINIEQNGHYKCREMIKQQQLHICRSPWMSKWTTKGANLAESDLRERNVEIIGS